MIRINKAANIPAILSGQGVIETTNLINAYNGNPNQFTSGILPARQIVKMQFVNGIYGDATVKQQLITDQHDKCCFCEARFSDNSYGDVEHYRPKKAYKRQGQRSYTYPGYYWLAYDWTNLMYSCEKCNRKHKGNVFPLGAEATRKPNHAHANPLNNEDRLLINPLIEDPSLFLTFVEEVPVPVNNNAKGSESIKSYGLERLNETRLDYLKALNAALVLANIDETNANEVANAAIDLKINAADLIDSIIDAKSLFNSAAKATAKFTLCVRCKFPNLPIV